MFAHIKPQCKNVLFYISIFKDIFKTANLEHIPELDFF